MNTREHQNGEMGKTQLPHDLADQTKPVDESRRGFTKSGLAISGVILTLASRPVLGDFVCKSPSGFLSGNVSAHGTPQTCSGLNPLSWGTQPTLWPSPYRPGTCSKNCNKANGWSTADATRFSNVFNYNQTYDKYTLMQVIWAPPGQDPDLLGAYIVAALLNAAKGLTPVLTEAEVKNMFNEWNQNGFFAPTAGVKWYGADIVAYLKSTMTL